MLTNDQWAELAPVFGPRDKRRKRFRGRPKVHSDRIVLEAVMWILRTGAQWSELPKKYPPYQTVHHRFQGWVEDGTLSRALTKLVRQLELAGGLSLKELAIDATFVKAKKGGLELAIRKPVKGVRSWRSPMLTLFLSPSTQQVLNATKPL